MSDIPGLKLVSDQESPIVFLMLDESTGSIKNDLELLENIAERVSNLISNTVKTVFTIYTEHMCVSRPLRNTLYLL